MPKSISKKLTKLKSMLKRLPTLSGRHPATAHDSSDTDTCCPPEGLRPVYVGKSRRRYMISIELAEHPLLQVLLQRSGSSDTNEKGDCDEVVGCEVVLFEHLLWMLQNGEGENESFDELMEFYVC